MLASESVMNRILVIFLSFALAFAGTLEMDAQRTSRSVRQQKQQTERKIRETDQQIQKKNRELTNKLNSLNLLTAEVSECTKSIKQLNTRIDSIRRHTKVVTDSISLLDARLKKMQKSMAVALKDSRRSRTSMSNLSFIFSAESFAQAYHRIQAVEQFSKWRQRKASEITSVKAQLDQRRLQLEELRREVSASLSKLNERKRTLVKKKSETDKLVKSLRNQSKQLKRVLSQEQAKARKLDAELERIIEQEQREAEERARREAEERARREAAQANGGKVESTKEQPKPSTPTEAQRKQYEQLSGSFAQNKGRLPYPADGRCSIVKRFGRQQHPTLKYVTTDNSGIDIQTQSGATVRAVFDGEVSAIICPDGYNNVVLVKHGSYVTVYANLGKLSVRKGEVVKRGQALGTVYVDRTDGNRSILHFEIRNATSPGNITKENPELWLRD